MSRFNSLLYLFKLNDRIISSSDDYKINKLLNSMDYNLFNQMKINEMKKIEHFLGITSV